MNKTYYDGVIYGHAINNDNENTSKCVIDLSDTPFQIDQDKQTFNHFGNPTGINIDTEDGTSQFLEMDV